ncbi:MAG: hypothetical protein GXO95_01600 [Nitrospirae bacterium]|nr:hypothetical protein [Nitrospirota bacterium]
MSIVNRTSGLKWIKGVEIGGLLGVDYSAVGQESRKLIEKVKRDRKLADSSNSL